MTINKRTIFISIIVNFIIIFFSIFILINQFFIYKLENRGISHLGRDDFIMKYSFGFYAKRLQFSYGNLSESTKKKTLSDKVIFSKYFDNENKKLIFIDSIFEMDELIDKQNLKNSIINLKPKSINYYLVPKKFNQEEVFNLLSKLNLYMSFKSDFHIDTIDKNIRLDKYIPKNLSCSDFKFNKKSWYTENCKFEVKLQKFLIKDINDYIKIERFIPERNTKMLDIRYKTLYKFFEVDYFKFITDIVTSNIAFFTSILIFLNFLIYLVIFNFTKFFNEKI